MTWMQVLLVLGSLGTYIFLIVQKLDQDIRYINQRVDALNSRIDKILEFMVKPKDKDKK